MKIKIAIFVKKWSEHAAKTRTEKNMIEVSDNYFIKTFFFPDFIFVRSVSLFEVRISSWLFSS